MAIHKKDEKISLFSRRLDDVTNQFPEIVKWSRECLKSKECIVEGEVLFKGKNLLTLKEEKMRSIRGKDIAMIF